ncbi:MAG: hypothetical protein P4L84_01710 [Isosphaeraceae bacterium]|nr:hypothetical protein [Isosphaeraceae bacterium]
MEHSTDDTEFEGRLRIVACVSNADPEEKGGFLYIHNIARAAIYWWVCDEADEAKLSDKLVVVCDIAEPAEPSDEPEVAVGEEAIVTFPVTIKPLDPELDTAAMLAEATRVVSQKVAEGADDFEGLDDFRVLIDVAQTSAEHSAAA